MTLRPVASMLVVISLAMTAGLAGAQTAAPTEPATETAAIRTSDEAVQGAAAPREPVARADRPTQMSDAEREAARAKRLERREIISEGIGIPVDDLNDLLRRVRPTAEERRPAN